MKLYEIQLPYADNEGNDMKAAREAWCAQCLKIVGGYSVAQYVTRYRKDTSDKLYVDAMQPVRVACLPEQFAALVDCAFRLFPDQLAIFTAEIGTAEIIDRATWNARIGAAVIGVVR